MAEIHRLSLSLQLDNPTHREAWNILTSIPRGHRTEAVCLAVLRQQEQENLRKIIREVIHDELKHTTIQASAEEPEDDAILGFLRSLQEGDVDL